MATLKNHPEFWMRDDAAAAFDRAESDHGVYAVNSAGRTKAQQEGLITRWDQGGTYNRPPYLYEPARPADTSKHVKEGGIAIDVADWRRFAEVAPDYGFSHPYPGGDPVHFEFGGGAAPAAIPSDQVTKDRQNWLNSRGYSLVVDGRPGPLTQAAYKSYQTFLRAYGYTGMIDGVWGPGTQAAHDKYWKQVNTPAPVAKKTTADYGRVDVVQRALKKTYPLYAGGLKVDNQDGPKTIAAVKEFQRRAGLTVDGVAGPATRKALGL